MSHAFAPAVAELKRLKNKLNSDTFTAVFAESPVKRQQSLNNAHVVKKEMEDILTKVSTESSQVSGLLLQPGYSPFDTVNALIDLVETSGSKMGAGSQQTPR
jgi:hypothetical protein